MIQFLDIVLYILLFVVLLVLAAGIFALFRGGEFGRTWSPSSWWSPASG